MKNNMKSSDRRMTGREIFDSIMSYGQYFNEKEITASSIDDLIRALQELKSMARAIDMANIEEPEHDISAVEFNYDDLDTYGSEMYFEPIFER